jgi:hypothetical protein
MVFISYFKQNLQVSRIFYSRSWTFYSELRPLYRNSQRKGVVRSALSSKSKIIIIIIISPLQSTAGNRPLQLLAISLDPQLLASSSCQLSSANHHSNWSNGILHHDYRDAVSTLELVYPSGCRLYG